MSYCTMLTHGEPYRFYATKEAALKAAQRHYQRVKEGVEIVWCDHAGVPKVWVAYVTPLGTELTQYWNEDQTMLGRSQDGTPDQHRNLRHEGIA